MRARSFCGFPTVSERLTKQQRIRRRSVFRRVQRDGSKVHTRHFVVLVAPSPEDTPGDKARLGLTVTKRVGDSPERNRVKRLVREVFRSNPNLFEAGIDYVFIAKRGAPKLDFAQVLAELQRAKNALQKATRETE